MTCPQNEQLRKDLELSQNSQTVLIDKLIACCKEVRTTPVKHACPFLGLSSVLLIHTSFHFLGRPYITMISRMRNGHSGSLRHYEKNWRREGRSSQLVEIEGCNAIPPTSHISNRMWMRPRDRSALNSDDVNCDIKVHETDNQEESKSVELNQGIQILQGVQGARLFNHFALHALQSLAGVADERGNLHLDTFLQFRASSL